MLEAKSSKNPTGVKSGFGGGIASKPDPLGRFPANLIHDGSQEVLSLFPNSKSTGGSGEKSKGKMGNLNWEGQATGGFKDNGSAARFFYCPKASKSERNIGCEGLEEKDSWTVESQSTMSGTKHPNQNHHPTVKPIALMEYLVKLVSRE